MQRLNGYFITDLFVPELFYLDLTEGEINTNIIVNITLSL